MSKQTFIFIGLVGLAAVGSVVGTFVFGQKILVANQLPHVYSRVPDVVLRTIDGRNTHVSDFLGKPLIVTLWAPWCSSCPDELHNLSLLQRELGDKIVVVVITRDTAPDQTQKAADAFDINGSLVMVSDTSDAFYQQIGGFAMPETLFVDQNGMIQGHRRGSMTLEEMRRRAQDSFHW